MVGLLIYGCLDSGMSDEQTTIKEIRLIIDSFVEERDWKQFHSPKNLAMSLSIEVAELMELFQWLSLEEANQVMESGKVRDDAIDEIADVLIYAFSFCIRNQIDISDAIKQKMKKNIKKYPSDKYRGRF